MLNSNILIEQMKYFNSNILEFKFLNKSCLRCADTDMTHSDWSNHSFFGILKYITLVFERLSQYNYFLLVVIHTAAQ